MTDRHPWQDVLILSLSTTPIPLPLLASETALSVPQTGSTDEPSPVYIDVGRVEEYMNRSYGNRSNQP